MADGRNAQLLSLHETTASKRAGIFGLGVGYQFNNWFRGDITGQYRGKSNFKGLDMLTFDDGGVVGYGSITTTPPSRNGSSSPTAMSISAPGGASRRSSAPALACRAVTISNYTDTGVGSLLRRKRLRHDPGLWRARRCVEVEFCVGGARRSWPTRSDPGLTLEMSYATSVSATASTARFQGD